MCYAAGLSPAYAVLWPGSTGCRTEVIQPLLNVCEPQLAESDALKHFVDQLQHRGYAKGLFEFHGGERPRDFNMYFNRRNEVWGPMRDRFHNGSVEIPDDPELKVDLTT